MDTKQANYYIQRVPTIQELYKHVVKKVAYKWEKLAVMLELDKDGNKTAAIRRDFWGVGVEICCIQSLHHWLREEGKRPVTWSTLLTCLEDIECSQIAKEIQEQLKEEATTTTTTTKVCKQEDSSTETMAAGITGDGPAVEKYNLRPDIQQGLRDYQWELALPGLSGQNYIICAPTGTGKTAVAGLVISEHLKRLKRRGRVVFMVNKVPLAHQQARVLQSMIHGAQVATVTGDKHNPLDVFEQAPQEMPFPLAANDIIVSTAGCVRNELKKGRIRLADITLIVIDECHHTHKNTDYAKIMELYLQEKIGTIEVESKADKVSLPQVIGLTATPGAGPASRPNLVTTMDHLISLCARMDAIGGIKTVEKNVAELETHRSQADFNLTVVNGRTEDDPVIILINQIMTHLEQMYNIGQHNGTKRWSQAYGSWLKTTTQTHQTSQAPNTRDIISTLQLLECLSNMLITYLNLRYEDALEVLDEFAIPTGENATPVEKQLVEIVRQLRVKLDTLPRTENPLLQRLEDVMVRQFRRQPESKAIVFVETKKQAISICSWVSSRASLANIKAHVVTGQNNGNTGLKMTKRDQDHAIRGFRDDKYNLLVATSVLEEGIDIPACNLVIRYQKVTSEIAKRQTQGRARAANSQSFSIISSNSRKQYQELMNEEKLSVVEEALKYIPIGEQLKTQLPSKQREILKSLETEEVDSATRKKQYSPYEVELICKKCQTFACNGSDIHLLKDGVHYAVPDPEFRKRITVKEHHTPATFRSGMSKTHKIYCSKCEQAWGVIGRWWTNKTELPILKCAYFFFKINRSLNTFRKWCNVPFEIQNHDW